MLICHLVLGMLSKNGCFSTCLILGTSAVDLLPGAASICLSDPFLGDHYNDLTATSLEMMVSKGKHPQDSLISG